MSSVTISVITATYNCSETLPDMLFSVKSQCFERFEHIVIDGSSTDGTIEILRENRSDFSFFLSEPDSGVYHALNKGMESAVGDVIGFMHASDVYASSDVLSSIAEVFDDPSVDAVYGDLQYVSAGDLDSVIRDWRAKAFSLKRLSRGWMPPHPTLYVRRKWYQEIGGFDLRFRISADYFSILRMFSRRDFKSIYLPKLLVKMRAGGLSNGSLSNIILKTQEDYQALRRTQVGGGASLIMKNLRKLDQFL